MEKEIPWWTPELGPKESELIQEVLQSNYVNEGEFTAQFEKQIAQKLDVEFAVAVTNGTSALFLSLVGLGVGRGDEVIVPDVTFIATANSVVMAGAKPVVVDVDPQTLHLDPVALTKAITPQTKAVIPVHVSGRGASMVAILKIAKDNGLFVVEDAAEAFMSKRDGKFLGTMGHAGCLSFSPNKMITTGQGGMILTRDQDLFTRLRELKDQGRFHRGTGGDDLHPRVGFNFKLTNLQAAVGLGQLTYLDSRIRNMKRIYERYRKNLADQAGISLFEFRTDLDEIALWADALVERRDELDRYLREHGIHCRRFWFPLHQQDPYRGADGDFPNSTRTVPKALWLPSSFLMSDKDVDRVCSHIADFFKKN